MNLSQSSFLVAMLLAGFLFYLAAKGRLSTYTAVLWGNTAQPQGGSSPGGSSGGSSDMSTAVHTATTAAEFAAAFLG